MKRFSEQLKKQANQTRMSVAERRALKERLVSYMEYHPLAKDRVATAHSSAEQLASESFVVVRFDIQKWFGVASTMAALLLIIVPVVAERAVPGDVLYPVKVQFNEEVRSSLALSPYQRVAWETTRLERRISEVRLLADAGKLTDEVEERAAEAVKEHSEAAQKEIATIAKEDSDEAALAEITFNTVLEVQSEVLESDAADNGGAETVAEAVAVARAVSAENQVSELPSYEKLLGRIESETTRAQEFLSSISDTLSETDQADVDRRLLDIDRKVSEATAPYASSSATSSEAVSDDTLVLLSEALSDTQKLISFLTDLEVKETVAIEDLVPVALTETERLEIVASELAEVTQTLATVEALLDTVDDEDLNLKVTAGIAAATEAMAIASSSFATTTVGTAEEKTTEARTILEALEETIRAFAPTSEVTEEETASSTEAVIETDEADTASSTENNGEVTATSSEAVIEEGTASSTEEDV